jgi:outer membrane protein OmpA-like peptidoglycan-associated protein
MVTGTFLEAYVLAVTAGNFYNDAITSANGRYLEETERLRKAREEIKAVFRGLDDTEITDEKGRVKIIMRGALFEYNKSALLERFHQRLDKLAEILVRYNEFPISVEGHTDNIGADTYNLKLSSERSGAISTYLIDNGKLDGKRIVALGYGKSRPIASNDTADGRALNRRVEIILQRNFTAGDKL